MSSSDSGTVRATVTISKGSEYLFPEQAGDTLAGKNNSGLCFSGGGNRALAAGMGQLRALTTLGLMEKVAYVSCVSGGSWLSAPYTYYRSGPANDEEFLGPDVPAKERASRTLGDWGQIDAKCIGHAATQDLEKLLLDLRHRVPPHLLWQTAIGQTYFEPFGLYGAQDGGARFFSLDAAAVAAILADNAATQPGWTADDFVTARPGRPYLVVNGTLIWPSDLLHEENRVLMQLTPLYVGNPWQLEIEERHLFEKRDKRQIGGGFVEPFAFQSTGPASPPPSSFRPPGQVTMEMPAAASRFTLWQASGISSDAPGEVFAKTHLTGKINPEGVYWPAGLAGRYPAYTYELTDGGNLENFGLMALLQRRVENVVIFVNSEKPLTAGGQIDGNVPPLFGQESDQYRHNAVFPNDEGQLESLVSELYASSQQGGLAVARRRYQTVPNGWFGTGSYAVNVLWVYNALVRDWLRELHPDVASAVTEGADEHKGPLKDFPNYSTILEEGPLHIAQLSAPQVSLLADMFAWSIERQGDDFAAFLE